MRLPNAPPGSNPHVATMVWRPEACSPRVPRGRRIPATGTTAPLDLFRSAVRERPARTNSRTGAIGEVACANELDFFVLSACHLQRRRTTSARIPDPPADRSLPPDLPKRQARPALGEARFP